MLTFRPATSGDLDAMLVFWRTAAEGTDRRDDRAGLERLLARDAESLVLAVDDGEVVGSLIAGWDGWRCSLYRLAVSPEHRRRGIAGELVRRAELRFAALGGVRADAMVLSDNDLGQAAWAAVGYAPQPAWRRWVKGL